MPQEFSAYVSCLPACLFFPSFKIHTTGDPWMKPYSTPLIEQKCASSPCVSPEWYYFPTRQPIGATTWILNLLSCYMCNISWFINEIHNSSFRRIPLSQPLHGRDYMRISFFRKWCIPNPSHVMFSPETHKKETTEELKSDTSKLY